MKKICQDTRHPPGVPLEREVDPHQMPPVVVRGAITPWHHLII